MASPVPAQRTSTAARPAPGGAARTRALVLTGWCALAWGIAAKDGRYGAWAMGCVLLGVLATALAVALTGRRRRQRRPRAGGGPAGLVTGSWALLAVTVGVGPIVRHPRYYASGGLASAADVLAIAAGLLAAASIAAALPARASTTALTSAATSPATSPAATSPAAGERPGVGGPLRRVLAAPALFWVVLALALGAGVATVRAAPAPRIDVFHLLQVSAAGLTHGADMYRQQWAPNRATYGIDGLFDVYPYLPLSTVLLAPFRLLFGDVRYGLLLALAVAALCARRLAAAGAAQSAGGDAAGAPVGGGVAGTGARGVPVLAMLPLLVVILPESMYALQQSWTEPLLVACLAAMVLAVRGGHPRAAVVAFALALAAKQHIVLLLPVAALWPAFGVRRAGLAAGLAALLVAPWVLAGPRDFVDDAVWTNLHYRVLGHSLSVPGWASHFGITVGFLPALVVLAAAYAGSWWARGDAVGFCLGGALVTVVLDLMNKQTFFNHYTLPMGLLVLAAVLLRGSALDGPASAPAGPPGEAQRSVEKRSSDAPS